MYIGDYSHNVRYGLYGNEALLLERRTFSLDDDDSDSLRAFFGRGLMECSLSARVLAVLQSLRGGAVQPAHGRHCTMLVGRKVTGDMHVPMGAATFVAFLDPPLPLGDMPSHITTTGSSDERVVRGWAGFGTLAFPGFESPSWDAGWLTQLEDDADGRRFAFVWGSMRGHMANLLTRVVAQSTAVFVGEDEALRPYWPPATPHTAS